MSDGFEFLTLIVNLNLFNLVFGIDSPLGLFPPGMDPTKMYNPLMDLPDHPAHHRQLHPDHPSFLKKKRELIEINFKDAHLGLVRSH